MAKFFGKYRGTVIDNTDPLGIGRLRAQVPDVAAMLGSTWAMPCFPFAGVQSGFLAVPLVGAHIWIEFEQGDINRPVWVGGFFGSQAEVPGISLTAPPTVQHVVLQTSEQNTISISDLPGPVGGILIKSATGASISVSDAGIAIANGRGASIALTGPAVVINGGALEVV
jgi:uncharacterized protein involved in type VI secretion and phage assembly